MVRASSTPGLEFENKVRQSLKRIGFKDIDGGPNLKAGGHQIDACGGWDDVLLVGECTQSAGDDASIRARISEVRGKQAAIRHGFRSLGKYETYRRLVFVLITRNIGYTQGDRDLASQRPPVHLIDYQTLEYYVRLSTLIGQRGALFNFLGELQIVPRDVDIPKLPAFRVRLSNDLPCYLFWYEPQELLKIAYVARRESGRREYYQRMLAPQRLRTIEKFIQQGGVFPNNIIVSFDKRPQFRPKPGYGERWPSWLEFGELIFPQSYRSCWVIDGQHRLYALGRFAPNPSAQKLAVFAFERLAEPKQAKFFIDINKEQKPVSLDLIWDLEGEMSPQTPRGRIANCVKRLNSIPPLRDKIFLPLSGERRRGQLKMSGICQDLEATGLLNDRTHFMTQGQRKNPLTRTANPILIPDRVATAVASFLGQVQTRCTEALWNGVLLRPGGITVALNAYEQILIRVEQTPTDEQLARYAGAFVDVLRALAPNQSEMQRLVREQLTSYAQRRQLAANILRQMQERLNDAEFAKIRVAASEPLAQRLGSFERRLAEVVTERLGIVTLADLKQKAPQGVWELVSERTRKSGLEVHQELTLGQTKEIIDRRDNKSVIMPIFTDPSDGFGDEQAVLAALAGIIRARNALDHGRRMGNRRLIVAYLETFEHLIGL